MVDFRIFFYLFLFAGIVIQKCPAIFAALPSQPVSKSTRQTSVVNGSRYGSAE